VLDPHDRKPRPYSRINPTTGVHEWVAPEERVVGPGKRSRLESDDEVRARIRAAGRTVRWTSSGKELDGWLDYYALEPRRMVDE
jgi:hypothetical protein